MMHFLRLSGILLIMALVQCQGDFPGYKKINKNAYLQLHKIGEDSILVNSGDYITCDLVYKTMSDSVFFSGRRKFQVSVNPEENVFDKSVVSLHKRDSVTIILPVKMFFQQTLETSVPAFLEADSNLKISMEIIDIQSPETYEREKEAFLHWIEDFGQYEKVILQQFIEEKSLEAKPTESGLYYLVLKEGRGRKVQKDDTLTVHYEGKFLNGKFFDSTVKRHEAFTFVYGQEWQVIPGLEEAIGRMREGEKALFIMPSELAWGKSGSSTGIIPPYTSLIFEVEVLELR